MIKNIGTIAVNSAGSGTSLKTGTTTGTTVRLTGGGTVSLSDNGQNFIDSNYADSTLENVDNTIKGAGQIQSNQGLTLVNDAAGKIIASATDNALVIHNITVTNKGLIEATGAAGLQINNATINNQNLIEAATGSSVSINTSTIVGGTLQTVGTGTIHTDGNTVLDGTTSALTIAAGSTVTVDNGNFLFLAGGTGATPGVINNIGTVAVSSIGSGTSLKTGTTTGTTVRLTGGGMVSLSDNNQNFIDSNYADSTLENVDNTIQGAGQIQSYQGLALVNDAAGKIIASAANNALVIHNITVTNKGLIEATGAAGLQINNATINNQNLIEAATGSSVSINTSTIIGGTLQTVGTGAIHADGNTVLDGTTSAVTIAAGSAVTVITATFSSSPAEPARRLA